MLRESFPYNAKETRILLYLALWLAKVFTPRYLLGHTSCLLGVLSVDVGVGCVRIYICVYTYTYIYIHRRGYPGTYTLHHKWHEVNHHPNESPCSYSYSYTQLLMNLEVRPGNCRLARDVLKQPEKFKDPCSWEKLRQARKPKCEGEDCLKGIPKGHPYSLHP